ncbi:MAG: MerR family DNA-binding transcriptional regulator [Fulvimarina manganoxydans]|uniref:MerR family transcriptional regulator n=1 Tax=Fulvimarina manganoxydans TaxID=937218 RepID=UPI00235353F6|nr:MerR family DNA-binding transcriptional regulator [Fulvimarina manganoxydans]MCK5933641.1 MerR family DNA-binding transcriptional regulator [Fulvimarina manganoxydans]
MDDLFTITELADELSITTRTIRFYEEQGLLSPGRLGSTRVYTLRDRARLSLIMRGKRLGFSIRDIQEYLELYDADPKHQKQTGALLAKARARIVELEEQMDSLKLTLCELRAIERTAAEALGEDMELDGGQTCRDD